MALITQPALFSQIELPAKTSKSLSGDAITVRKVASGPASLRGQNN